MTHFLDFILLFAMQIMFHVHIHMFDVSFLFFIYIINFASNTLSSHMESWQVTFHSSKCKTVIYIYNDQLDNSSQHVLGLNTSRIL